jgi:uncharacterized membrane protein
MDGLDFMETQRMGCVHKILSHLTRTRLDSSEERYGITGLCFFGFKLLSSFLYVGLLFYSNI